MAHNLNYWVEISVSPFHMGEKKVEQFEEMKKSILDLAAALPHLEPKAREQLTEFIHELIREVMTPIAHAIETEQYFGCWLRANNTYMPTVLYELPQVMNRGTDDAEVRRMKDTVIWTVETFLNCSVRTD